MSTINTYLLVFLFTTSSIFAFNGNIGFFHMEIAVKNTTYVQNKIKTFEQENPDIKTLKSIEEDIEELTKKIIKLQDENRSKQIADNKDLQSLQILMADKRKEYQFHFERMNQSLNEMVNSIMNKHMGKINSIVQNHIDKQKITILLKPIFPVLYFDESMDITNDVTEELNQVLGNQ